MSGHHPHRGIPHRHPAHPAIWAAAAAIILLAAGACTSTTTTGTSASAVAAASTGPGGQKPTLTGAGSTFDAPFFSAAFARYQQQHPGVTIGYSAVGSSAGIAAISAKQVDFGASDVPMTASEQAAATGGPITQVPVALGGEGIVYNLSLPAGARLHLTGPVLAAIFLGQITRWNDPALTALNPGLSLPAAAINVVHRSDGSGTTYIFSNYLSSVDPAWASKVGTGKTLNWPAGEGAEGNGGVATAVNRTPFSIGYVEQAYSQGLTTAVRRHPQPGRELRHPIHPDRRRRRRPETRHHPHRLLHRQPARRQQLPDQRVQLGAGLHPPARTRPPGRPWSPCSTGSPTTARPTPPPTATYPCQPRSSNSPAPCSSRSPAPPGHTSSADQGPTVTSPGQCRADAMQAVVMLAVTAPGGPPLSTAGFPDRLEARWLGTAWDPGRYPQEASRVRRAARHLPDIQLRYATLLERLGPALDGPGTLADADAWYCILEGTREPSVAEAQAMAITELTAHAATALDSEPRAMLLAADAEMVVVSAEASRHRHPAPSYAATVTT